MEYALFFVLLIYLLPWILAELRRHPRSTAILAMNVAFGWTLVGWIGALGWALWRPNEPHREAELRPILRAIPGGRRAEPLSTRPAERGERRLAVVSSPDARTTPRRAGSGEPR